MPITELTIPINLESFWMTEFDVWIDYTITFAGSNVTRLHPAEGPEWEVVEIRGFPTELHKQRVHFDVLPKLSGCLLGYTEDYLASPLGREDMIQSIEDEQFSGAW